MPRFVLLLSLLATVAACGGSGSSSPTQPTVNVPFSVTDLVAGTGTQAVSGNRLTVHYTGWLYQSGATDNKGRQFDSSRTSGTPYSFTLGAGQVIRGWDQGIVGMRVGGQRRLVIPPDLAYGSTGAGNGVIPANATLIFDVELLSIN